jgi:hypothetical protein
VNRATLKAMIKPLLWVESKGNFEGHRVWSYEDDQSIWIVYDGSKPSPKYLWCLIVSMDFYAYSPVMGEHDTLEEAKDAVQEYHAEKILGFFDLDD